MSDDKKQEMKKIGAIEWRDLTVNNADNVSDFYSQVVGWQREPVSMGDYDDYTMNNSDDTVAGICHARGSNANIPPQWLMYVRVKNAELSAQKTIELGGDIIQGPTKFGGDTYYVIRDPAGAILSIFS